MSSVIVDTHILIWDQLDPKKISPRARKAIDLAERSHKIILCEISLWEIAVLIKKKRLVIDMPYLEFIDTVLQTKNYELQGMNPEIAFLAGEIDIDTRDPADRIIVATSLVLGIPLISADQFMQQSAQIKSIW